jgi:DnaK suppressor protein
VAGSKKKKSGKAPKAKSRSAKTRQTRRPATRKAARSAGKKRAPLAKRKRAAGKKVKRAAGARAKARAAVAGKSRAKSAAKRPAKSPAKRTKPPLKKAGATHAAPAKSAKPVAAVTRPGTKPFVLSPARPPLPVAPTAPTTVVKTPPRPPAKPLRVVSKKEAAAPPRPVVPETPIDVEAVRRRLRAKKDEILAMYLKDLRTGQESNDSPTEDIVDRANNAYSRELNFSISDAERAFLLQIEEALERLDSGTYGKCAHCGDPIARPRLDAIPWARLCIRCQELFEQGLLAEG